MKILKGGYLRSKITGHLFAVREIRDRSVVLESEDELNEEWTDMGNLPFFFEEVETRRE